MQFWVYGWMILVGIFWFSVFTGASTVFDKIKNKHPTARMIGILRNLVKHFKSLKPNEYPISINKIIREEPGNEISIVCNGQQMYFSEEEGRLLTIHLMSLYPEMQEDPNIDAYIDGILYGKTGDIPDNRIEGQSEQNAGQDQPGSEGRLETSNIVDS